MRLFKYVCIALVAALALSCSDEDPINVGKVKEGLSARMSLSVNIPITEKVEVTRGINDYESEINELVIVMFETTSHRKEVIDLTGKLQLQLGTVNNIGGREYALADDVKTTSGTYNAYAIANYSSPYCGLTLDELTGSMSEEELQGALSKNLGKVHTLNGYERLPMSQIITDLTIYSDEEVANSNDKLINKLDLTLTRIIAHIEFEFKNGDGKGVTFNPYEYTVYNLPDGANLFTKDNNELGESAVTYFNTDICSTGGSSFDFFMLENVQTNLQGEVSSYNDRDKWNDFDGTMKNFTNAPKNSTYVVVKGTYYGDVTGDAAKSYIGECTYTIHLGDFSETGSMGNFNVNRNEFHKYTVTINGASSITQEAYGSVEVEVDGGIAPGAEGLLRQNSNTFILDAHYERVRIAIESEKYGSLKEGTVYSNENPSHRILINTPKTDRENKIIELTLNGGKYEAEDKDADIDWIKFMKPIDIDTVPSFDETQAGNILDFLSDVDKYCLQDGSTYYTYAYVDEYFYEDIHPKRFVNVMNRTFILDPSEMKESPDKQSVVYEGTIFEISQRSIKSSFDMETIGSEDQPYGIETWNETGGLEWVKESGEKLVEPEEELSSDYGLMNTKALVKANGIGFDENVWSYIGYRYVVNDNSKARHRWYDESHYKDYLNNKDKYKDDIHENINNNIKSPLTAVLARNRIKVNADGSIDENSIKWYLPAISQYLIVWLGQNQLQEDTRLMDVTKLTEMKGDEMDRSQHYLTSSASTRRLYWQDQGSCWSVIAAWNAIGNNNGLNINKIRCMRNLRNDYMDKNFPSKTGVTKDSPVKFPVIRTGRVFELDNIANARSTSMMGGYGAHTEREPENYLYRKFEVADPAKGKFTDVTKVTEKDNYICCGFSPSKGWGFSDDIAAEMNEIAALYYQNEDKSDLGEWRVPNQREMMIVAVMDHDENDRILPKNTYLPMGEQFHIYTTTWFTGYSNTSRSYPFVFYSGKMKTEEEPNPAPDYNMNLMATPYGKGALLFVRDVK
ncbi:MAG: fimbrial protein [Bacteroides sp.]|nr:fimbrial protein [Roseburia sp.]MCM1345999.1 fimbrial protein [Bacteroides sp.]MCM1420842.1 fimbrial protein [Bacteroides sp.]